MIRLIAISVLVFVTGWLTLWFLSRPGTILIEWQDWEIRTTVGATLLAALLVLVIAIVLSRILFSLLRLPKAVSAHSRTQTRERGLSAISKGLIAVATGDLKLARRYARQARALLPEQPLTKVLLAQKAQLEGDDKEAAEHFTSMLSSPDTELLGRQGLIQHAINTGDQAAALKHAERAFELRPKVRWAYEALLDHQLETCAWDKALKTVAKGQHSGHISLEDAKLKRAIFLTAKAYEAFENGDREAAESFASHAQRQVPGLTPAAILAARILIEKGAFWKASGILEEAWRALPHPALIEVYAGLKPDESIRMRAKRLMGLVEMRPDHPESRLLRARIAINTHEWQEARDALAPLIESKPTPRVCALMAEIEQGEGDNIGAAREWMARALSAPPEPEWLRTDFRLSAAAWGQLAVDIDEWPPQFGERRFERTVRTAPIHGQLDLLGEPVEDEEDGEPTFFAAPDETEEPTTRTEADGSLVIVSPLRSRPDQALQVEKAKQPRALSAAPGTPKPVPAKKSKSKSRPAPAAKSAAAPAGGENKVAFSLSHQPDDPGPSSAAAKED